MGTWGQSHQGQSKLLNGTLKVVLVLIQRQTDRHGEGHQEVVKE